MVERSPRAQEEEVKMEGVVTMDEAPPKTKLSFDLATSMSALHTNPSQRVEDESTETHHVSRFVFKVNNTLFVAKVFLDKDLKKS